MKNVRGYRRRYDSKIAASFAIALLKIWDSCRLAFSSEKILSKKYHVITTLDKKYIVVRMIVTQQMIDDLNEMKGFDSTLELEDSLYDTTHRYCQACIFEKNGVKTRKAIKHTCAKSKKRTL